MNIKIIFETHATSIDNENKIASGWRDVPLSAIGQKEARDLLDRRKESNIQAVYCSDLKRAYQSAMAFESLGIPVVQDARLRECNYGDMNGIHAELIKKQKIKHISQPFPRGESYKDCAKRMGDFLECLKQKYKDGATILIIGHRATQYGLNHHILKHSIAKCVTVPFKWQPGWTYTLTT